MSNNQNPSWLAINTTRSLREDVLVVVKHRHLQGEAIKATATLSRGPCPGMPDQLLGWRKLVRAGLSDISHRIGRLLSIGSRAVEEMSRTRRSAGKRKGRSRNRAQIRRTGLAVTVLLAGSAFLLNGSTRIQGPDSPQTTRVLIVDDHPLMRRGLALSLTFPEFEVVGEVGSGEEALRLLEQVRPNLVLMDLMMPGMGGVATIRAIHELAPETKHLVQEALRAGAIGYQLKDADVDQLVTTIRMAIWGMPSLAPAAAQSLVGVASDTRKLGDDLSAREREALALLVRGLSNTAIAEALVVTEATVKFHLHSIRRKLGTTTRTQTVAVALQHHLVPPP
jgi:two-component system, NarL family, response regulator LiaR